MTLLRKGAYIPGITQNLATSSTSTTTTAVNSNTSIIRIAVTKDTYVSLATTATSNDMLMPGGDVEFLSVDPGITVVSAVQVTTAGIISVTELE